MSALPTTERPDARWGTTARTRVGRVPSTALVSIRPSRFLAAATACALGGIPVVALGFSEGGFFPVAWGRAALGLSLVALVALCVSRRPAVSRRPTILLAGLTALGLWMLLSFAWTQSPGLTLLELQRLLVYLAAVAAAALVVEARTARAFVTGVFLATTAVVLLGLVTYLLTRERTPDVLQGAYLHRPLGYANGMAIVSVVAILLALGIVAGAGPRSTRVAAATAIVPLSVALALTGSRAALGTVLVGAAVAAALEPSRGRLLVIWPWVLAVPVLAVLIVSSFTPTSTRIHGAPADALGNRLLVLVVFLTALAVPPAIVATRAAAGHPGRLARRLWTAAGLVLLTAIVAVGVARFGGLAGDRPLYWRVALEEIRDRPLLGSGPGTYAQVWLERRTVDGSVRDAHSLPIEAFAELGLGGVALVLLVLAMPLVWACRARREPLVPAAAGAFAAFAAHASVDWDWELPAVTLAGLSCAVAIGATADEGRVAVLSTGTRRVAALLAAGSASLALGGLVGAHALEEAGRALARGDAAAAAGHAASAGRWQPWSAEPLLVEGRARLALGDRAAAAELFARAAAREPRDYRTWLALAAVSPGDAARAAVVRAHELNPRAVRGLPSLDGGGVSEQQTQGREAQ